MPENAHNWSCNKPVNQNKVGKYTRCKIVCLEGFDFSKSKCLKPYEWIKCNAFKLNNLGKRREFHRCKRNGEWQTPSNVILSCKPNGEWNKILKNIQLLTYNFKVFFSQKNFGLP